MKLKVGEKYIYFKTFSSKDVDLYAELTGDYNPIHFDENYSKSTIFRKPIIHGPLLLTFITSIFAQEIPGPGSVYLSHEIKFLKPVYRNQKIKLIINITDIDKKGHIFLSTNCFNELNEMVFSGLARLKVY